MPREIIAILRGVRPHEVEAIGAVLIESGISTIEVPLNSPDPFDSISRLARAYADVASIGAGTVLSKEDVTRVADAGGRLIVSPDTMPEVIAATKALGLASYPGVLTPTECFCALRNGADGLKFFPSNLVGPDGLKAVSAVLPAGTRTYAVGGVGPGNFQTWLEAGVTGFGIGSGIYKAGMTADTARQNARDIVVAYDRAVDLVGHS
ncbi:2-dehydro-3-deoxy-6-phosphogalactonate aldolase [Rhodobacteraceae bacterium (ex Bugula neritina AB1)]|nr:2-dehydro-3-deoxy-6-phosphogalactonate aldolase [Rhodobacteraceae bacterium (ex Bugula neritina AB1)]